MTGSNLWMIKMDPEFQWWRSEDRLKGNDANIWKNTMKYRSAMVFVWDAYILCLFGKRICHKVPQFSHLEYEPGYAALCCDWQLMFLKYGLYMRYEQERSAELVLIKIVTDFDTKKKNLTLRWTYSPLKELECGRGGSSLYTFWENDNFTADIQSMVL